MWLTRRHVLSVWAACLAPADRARAGTLYVPATPALRGFDPVSYFLGAPEPGNAAFELAWNARTWWFARAANREAFRRAPDAYAPRLHGFDPVRILDDRLVETDPAIFLCLGEATGDSRLYLFRNDDNRARMLADPTLAGAAEARWPRLRDQLDSDFTE